MQHQDGGYGQQQQSYPPYSDAGYDYSYPPNSGNSAASNEKQYGSGGLNSPEVMLRQTSLGGETLAGNSVYDEKNASTTDLDLPPAIPRYPNGRPGGGHNPLSSVSFQPGHISRGSVALLAAAEGKIPKKEGLKMWRSDEHHGTFTAGGKRRTCMRCCCCTIILAIILIAGIVAAFLLWVRPPNVQFQGVLPPQDGTEQLNVTGSSFNLNFDLDIAVSNPNFFGASFRSIRAKAYYPGHDQNALGGGQMLDVKIPAHSHNTLYFPFAINYTKSIDPNSAILLDIATKCGFIGDAGQSDIKVNYDLTLALKILAFTISPTFSSSTSFACPLSQSDIEGLVGGAGGSGLGGLLGGGGGGSR